MFLKRAKRLSLVLMLVVMSAQLHAATRVYYQDFDDPATVEDFWLNNDHGSKALVSEEDGAEVLRGNCLRGNWAYCYEDPITHVVPNCESYDRYSGYTLRVQSLGITDEMYLDYWTRIDADAPKAYGCKWIWLQGNYTIPGEYGNAFNPIVQFPWAGWNTIMVNGNNTVGESGGTANDRDVQIANIPGIAALRGSMGVDEWFQGRWHHFQVYVKLNTPASASNGIIRIWIDEVLVMDFDDYKMRDVDADNFSHFVTPMMYGGGDPPPGPFGWQLDEMAIWDGMPTSTPSNGACGAVSGTTVESLSATSSNLCAVGSVISFTADTDSAAWGCSGVNGGMSTANDACTATLQALAPLTDIILDNTDPNCTSTGTWVDSTHYPDFYGVNYRYSSNSLDDTFTWTTNRLDPGRYNVFAWWSAASTRPNDVSYSIVHAAGSAGVSNINQREQGGHWVLLGTYVFGNTGSVTLIDSATGTGGACADAVRFITADSPLDAGVSDRSEAADALVLADVTVADNIAVHDAGQGGDDVVRVDARIDAAHADTNQPQTDTRLGVDIVAVDGDTNTQTVIGPGCNCRSVSQSTTTPYLSLLILVTLWGRRRRK